MSAGYIARLNADTGRSHWSAIEGDPDGVSVLRTLCGHEGGFNLVFLDRLYPQTDEVTCKRCLKSAGGRRDA